MAAPARPRGWLPRLAALVLAIGVGLAALLAAVVVLAVDPLPTVDPGRALRPEDVDRVRRQLQAADPRRLPDGHTGRISLRGSDLGVLLDDASRRLVGGSARVVVEPGQARVELSAALPVLARRLPVLQAARWAGGWINLSTRWRQTPAGWPQLEAVRLGDLPLPVVLVEQAVALGLRHYHLEAEASLALAFVEQLRFDADQVALSYRWRGEWRDRVRDALIPPEQQARLRVYHEALAEEIARHPGGRDTPIALVDLLPPLFERAERRSAGLAPLLDAGADAAALAGREHRALLLVLALYAAEQPPARFVSSARDWPVLPVRPVQLGGRDDFAQHFLVSAFVAAEGGGRLADAVGIYKEVADARGGSGFSFNDLAADRAGTRFGQRAAGDPLALQQALAARRGRLADADLLPDVADLPEFLSEAAFRRDYGRVGSPAYQAMVERIERRIRALPLLQAAGGP